MNPELVGSQTCHSKACHSLIALKKTEGAGTESELTMGVAAGLCPPLPAEDRSAGW